MKKEYNRPELDIVELTTDSIMETGGINLSAEHPNDLKFDWEDWQ